MRRTVVLLVVTIGSPFSSAAQAQDSGPIRNPLESIYTMPQHPQAACVDEWSNLEPLYSLDWRDFPPSGLVEEVPQRLLGDRWVVGIGVGFGIVQGPRTFTYDAAGRLTSWTLTFGEAEDPTEDQVRVSYTYDDSGNKSEVTLQTWSGTEWENRKRSIYSYSNSALLTSEDSYLWYTTGWIIDGQVRCSYDPSGKLIQRVYWACTPTSTVIPPCLDVDSTLYAYDAAGRIELDYKRFRDPHGAWTRPVKRQYTYDETGRLLESLDTGSRSRTEFEYDDLGRLAESVEYANYTRRRHRYDYQHAGELTRVAEDAWDLYLKAWHEEGEIRYQYDPLLDLQAVTMFLGPAQVWSREEYRYDHRNNLVEEGLYDWSGANWVERSRGTYVYSDTGLLEEYVLTIGDATSDYKERIVYGYAVGTRTSYDEPGLPGAAVLRQNYPNPFSLSTTISYELPQAMWVTLSVVDLMGRQVRLLDSGPRTAGRHDIVFDTDDLASGIYLYRLDAGAAVQTRRLLVIK